MPWKQLPNAHKAMSDFITRFFDEKKLENKCYEVESSNGVLHILHTEDVIYAIKQMPESNRSRVETVLRQLDAKDGDIHHFLRFIARGLAAFIHL